MATTTAKTKLERKSPQRSAAKMLPLAAPETDIVSQARSSLGVTRKVFARLTGFSERSIASWESGKELTATSRPQIVSMQRLYESLSRVIKPEFIAQWLEAPNESLKSFKPIEVIERGEIDRIWRLLYQLDAGIPD